MRSGAAAPARGEPTDGQPVGAVPAGQPRAAGAVHLRTEAAARLPPGHAHLGRLVRVGGAAAAGRAVGHDLRSDQQFSVRNRVADARDGAAAPTAAGAAREGRDARSD